MIEFPTLEEALELHRVVIEHFGGDPGVRDMGLLESALYRPQTGYYEDIVEMAGALIESILVNHPFVDGNKRAAFFLADVFLRMNGWKIVVDPKPGYQFIIECIDQDQTERFSFLTEWLRHHIRFKKEDNR